MDRTTQVADSGGRMKIRVAALLDEDACSPTFHRPATSVRGDTEPRE
jgi:hypothetical protein